MASLRLTNVHLMFHSKGILLVGTNYRITQNIDKEYECFFLIETPLIEIKLI